MKKERKQKTKEENFALLLVDKLARSARKKKKISLSLSLSLFFFFYYINRTQIPEEQKADYMCNASICTLHRNCSFFFLPLVLSSVNTANH